MKTTLKVLIVATCFMFTGCGIVQLSLRPHEYNATNPESATASKKTTQNDSFEECDCKEKIVPCEECKIIPQSGMMKDLRYGYYYDPKEKKCKHISYSSGGVPAPFKTMEECKSCCCKNW